MDISAEALAAKVAYEWPGAYRILMALSLHGGRAGASLLAAMGAPPGPQFGHDEFEDQLGRLERFGAVSVRRTLRSVLLRVPGRREVVLTRTGEEVVGRLWERIGWERMERKVRFVGEDSRRVRILATLRLRCMDVEELGLRAGILQRPELEDVVSDLAQEELVFVLRTYWDGERKHVTNVGRTSYGFTAQVTDVGLTGDGYVVEREAARRYPPQEAYSAWGEGSPGVE